MKKIVIIIIVLIIIGAGGYFFFIKGKKVESSMEGEQERTTTVQRGDLVLTVSTTGRVVSNLDVDIKSKASGEIVSLPFDVSDEVKTGELLVELDPVDEQRSVTQKETSLEAAKARLADSKESLKISEINLEIERKTVEANLKSAQQKAEESEAKLKREEDLFSKKLISQEDLDAAVTSVKTARSQLVQAEAALTNIKAIERGLEQKKYQIKINETSVKNAEIELDLAKRRLGETKIYAPMDAVVSARNVQKGQIIASGISNVGGGTTLLTLSDLSHVFVIASIDESDIGKLRINQEALITTDAFPSKRFKGKIVRIATKGTNQSNVVIFDVKIEVFGEGIKYLKPEMTANIEITADKKNNILVLPNEAIKFEEDYYYVELPKKAETKTDGGQSVKSEGKDFRKESKPETSASSEKPAEAVQTASDSQTVQSDSVENQGRRADFGGREQFAGRDRSQFADAAAGQGSEEQSQTRRRRDFSRGEGPSADGQSPGGENSDGQRTSRRWRDSQEQGQPSGEQFPSREGSSDNQPQSRRWRDNQNVEQPQGNQQTQAGDGNQNKGQTTSSERPQLSSDSGQGSSQYMRNRSFGSGERSGRSGRSFASSNRKIIEIGISDGIKTEIVRGLQEGEVVSLGKGSLSSRWVNQGQGGRTGQSGSPGGSFNPRTARMMTGGR